MGKFSIKKIWDALPKEDFKELAIIALQKGQSVDEIINDLVEIADKEIDWKEIFPRAPEELTATAELIDGPTLRILISMVVRLASLRAKR